MKERDILHESGSFWVAKSVRGFEVFKVGATHSTRCAVIGFEGEPGLARAIAECDRRAALESSPYGEWCRDPNLCKGKGYCPRDPTCGD